MLSVKFVLKDLKILSIFLFNNPILINLILFPNARKFNL